LAANIILGIATQFPGNESMDMEQIEQK
jgi:hypothetical protein